jgi:IS30 family transposase
MTHLTREQRYGIFLMLQERKSRKAIAKTIGVSESTISRELRRNCDKRNGSYDYDLAQRKYETRLKLRGRKPVFTKEMKDIAISLLEEGYSPEQIKGRSNVEGFAMVSHETIYRWIWEDKRKKGSLYLNLRRKGKRYNKRGNTLAGRGYIPNRIDIEERPAIVDLKERFGDLEIDTVIGSNHKGALVTINDRLTSKVWIRKLSGKDAAPLALKTIEALQPIKDLIHTITADNGKVFFGNIRK